MSDAENIAFNASCDFFRSVLANPDIDQNGVVDPLEGIRITLEFNVNLKELYIPAGSLKPNTGAGSLWADGVAVQSANPYINIYFPSERGEIHDQACTLELPDGTIVNGEDAQSVYEEGNTCFKCGNQVGLPSAGEYSFILPSLNLSFNYTLSENTSHGAFLYAVIPTVVLNDDNTINKVTWEIVDPDFNSVERPSLLIDYIYMGFDGENDGSQNQLYSSSNVEPDISEHIFEDQTILWNDVVLMYTSVTDYMGNRYETMIKVEH